MDFYEVLWEFVRMPRKLVEYAHSLGVDLGPPPDDFADRLLFVARGILRIMEVEASDVPQFRERCRGAMRFLRDVLMDLESYGVKSEEVAGLEAQMRRVCTS